jgi:hypothetical protein
MFAVYAEKESTERGAYLSGLLQRFNIRSSISINPMNNELTKKDIYLHNIEDD